MRPYPSTAVWRASALFASAVVGLAFAAAPGAQPAERGHAPHHHGAAGSEAWSNGDALARALLAAMNKMHLDMVQSKPSGNADRDFLAMMIPHHEGAVEMARLVLIHGKDPLVRRLAEEIIASQQAEIAAMQARLRILEAGPDAQPGGYPALGGARGEAIRSCATPPC